MKLNLEKTKIVNDRGVFKKKIDSDIFYLPNDFCEESLSIHSKVIFNREDRLEVLYDYVTCHNVLIHRNDTISKTETDKHIYPIFHTGICTLVVRSRMTSLISHRRIQSAR